MKSYTQFINEQINETYTMYSGISLDEWENIWEEKNIKDRITNVSSDLFFAIGYSYNYSDGDLMKLRTVVKIDNIPLEAFVSYRNDEYDDDDDDFYSMNNLPDEEKKNILNNNSLFLVNLFPLLLTAMIFINFVF